MSQSKEPDVIRMTGVLTTENVVRIYAALKVARKLMVDLGIPDEGYAEAMDWVETVLKTGARHDILGRCKSLP
jgi:hypothetical protein